MNASLLWDPLKPGNKERVGPSAWLDLLSSLRDAISNEPIPYTRKTRMNDVRELLQSMGIDQEEVERTRRATPNSAPSVKPWADVISFSNNTSSGQSVKAACSTIQDLTVSDTKGSIISLCSQDDNEDTSGGICTLDPSNPKLLADFQTSLRLILSESGSFVTDFHDFNAARNEGFRTLTKRGLMCRSGHEANLNTIMLIWANILSRERASRLWRLTGPRAPKPFKFPQLDDLGARRRAICEAESDCLVKLYDAYVAYGHLMHHPIMQNMYLASFYRSFWMLAEEIDQPQSTLNNVVRKHGLQPSKQQGPTSTAFKWIMFRLEGIHPAKKKHAMETKLYNLTQLGRFVFSMQRTFGKGALGLLTPGSLTKYLPLDSRAFVHIAQAIKKRIPTVRQICSKLAVRLVNPVLKQQYVEARDIVSIGSYTYIEYIDMLLPETGHEEYEEHKWDEDDEHHELPAPFELRQEEFPPLG